jgi:hypothetical protein
MKDKVIVKIEKEDREDISNYIATLENGETIGIEAKSKSEARRKITLHLEALANEA